MFQSAASNSRDADQFCAVTNEACFKFTRRHLVTELTDFVPINKVINQNRSSKMANMDQVIADALRILNPDPRSVIPNKSDVPNACPINIGRLQDASTIGKIAKLNDDHDSKPSLKNQ